MTDNNDIFDDDFMAPERDELRTHGKRQPRGNSIPIVEDTVQLRASGAVRFLLTLLVFGLLGIGGAGYFFYTQGQVMLGELETADNRIRQLESRLSMTDEAAQQSSLGLLERVDFNFTEIDKLWAARNQNRANITANTTSVEDHDETLSAMEKVIGGQSTTMNEVASVLATVQTRLETLSTSFAGVSNLGEQLTRINDDLSLVKESMASQGTGLAGRVDSNEQDIESINIYRLQLNQTLNSIQSSINNLQQQVGTQ